MRVPPSGLVLGATAFVTFGCASSLEGRYVFSVETPAEDGAPGHVVAPDRRTVDLAVGAEAILSIDHTGIGSGVPTYTRATSSASDVFDITHDDGVSRVTLRARREGHATLDIVAPNGLGDHVDIGVFVPDHVSVLADALPGARDVNLLVAIPAGENVSLPARTRVGERELVGPGAAPLRLVPEDAGSLQSHRASNSVDVTLTRVGRVEIVGVGVDPLRVDVIAKDDVDTLVVEKTGTASDDPQMLRPLVTLKSDLPAEGAPSALVTRWHQLLSRNIEIVERTPAYCHVRITDGSPDGGGVGVVEITHVQNGTCAFDVRAFGASFAFSAPFVRLLLPG